MCCSNSHQGIPSTTVTASRVTQGRVEYESMIPRGMDKGLDLWEAIWVLSPMKTHMMDVGSFSGLPDVVVSPRGFS